MNIELQIKYDLERSIKLYNQYFNFHRTKFFRNSKVKIISVFTTITFLLITGLATNASLPFNISCIAFLISIGYIIFKWNQFEQLKKQMHIHLVNAHQIFQSGITFSMNTEYISANSVQSSNQTKWDLIKKYEINHQAVYLYFDTKGTVLYDIIAADFIGEENYWQLLDFLNKKFSS